MASRTKDNDFSRIKLTDDEIEAKKKREAELIRKNLADKVERMKARIEMEEKEKMLPKKRKRKSKNGEIIESVDDHHEDLSSYKESTSIGKNSDRISSDRSNNIRKPPRPPPPNLSITELLQLAEKKQHEPMDVIIKKKEEEKLMTKKERKIMEEDLARQRRKQLAKGIGSSSKSHSSAEAAHLSKTKTVQNSEKSEGKKPLVIHVVERDVSKPHRDESKFKIPKSGVNAPSGKNVPRSHKDSISNSNVSKLKSNNSLSEKSSKSSLVNGHKKVKSQDERHTPQRMPASQGMTAVKKVSVPKQNGIKDNKSSESLKKSESRPKIDEEALEKKIREKMEKEIEERLAARFAAQIQALQNVKTPQTPKPLKKEPVRDKKTVEKPTLPLYKLNSLAQQH